MGVFKVLLEGEGREYNLPWDFDTLKNANEIAEIMAKGCPFHVTTITIKETKGDGGE